MNVNLGPVFDQFVANLLKTGLYQSQSEVVRDGLRLLMEREELKKLRLDRLRREIHTDRRRLIGANCLTANRCSSAFVPRVDSLLPTDETRLRSHT